MISFRPTLLLSLTLLTLASACGPRESRDVAGARVEVNPPKTEDFLTKVNAVQPGTRIEVVREALGEPDERREGFIDARPEPGPGEPLAEFADPGTRFRQWVYKRGDSHYHVYFTRGTRGGTVDWEVL